MKYKLKNKKGLYFVQDQGFTASSKCAGTTLTDAEITALADEGYCGIKEEVTSTNRSGSKSYAVVYIRSKDVVNGEVEKLAPNANLGEVDPSKRRFATFAEAKQHGSRFNVRKANAGDKAGSAGHVGFYVIGTNDEVNAKVNWATGLTNSIA